MPQKTYHSGIASLSAVLKKVGHQTALVYVHSWKRNQRNRLLTCIKTFKPDLIGISAVTNQFERTKQIIHLVNTHFSIPILIGGVHATISPEKVIQEDILGLCRGEGEEAILEFVDAFEKNKPYNNIRNFWFKKDWQIIKNPVRPLIKDLDSLPYPDYSIFNYQDVLNEFGCLDIFANRGCPYQCNYCVNHTLMELYKNKGQFARYRSVKSLISELEILKSQFKKIKTIEFYDDTFVLNKKWLGNFLGEYSKKIGIPFRCNARADLIDKETAKLLRKSGCYMVSMAIETGNEELRRTVLNKNITNRQIRQAFAHFKKQGIKIYSHNMIGIPYETPQTVQETINLNREVGVDVAQCWIFYPYPGTQAYELCKKNNWISSRKVTNVASLNVISILDQPTITKEQISYYHKIMHSEIVCPNSLKLKILKKIAKNQQIINFLLWTKHFACKIAPIQIRRIIRKTIRA